MLVDIRFHIKKAPGDILERLQKATDEIYQCYSELEELGILVIGADSTGSGKTDAVDKTDL